MQAAVDCSQTDSLSQDQQQQCQQALTTAPDAKGTLLEFNTNTYFLAGHPALRAVGIGNGFNNGHITKVMDLQSIFGGKLYDVGYIARPETFATYLQTVQEMIDSFQSIRGGG